MRVPTYANTMNMASAIQGHHNAVDHYTYQSITGNKYENYSGYGMKAYNIVSMESTLKVTNTFMENNKLANISLNTSNLALQTITDALSDVKAALTDLSGTDLEKISPDYTGGSLQFTSNNASDYLGKTLTINGTTYTFATSDGTNNINIDNLDAAEDIMQAVVDKIGNSTIKYEDGKISFPLYAIDGVSTALTEEPAKSAIKTGAPHMMNEEQLLALENVQRIAFASMQMIADTLNSNVGGKYIFGGGSSTKPVDFNYSSLSEFQDYYDGINTVYPSSSSAVLSNMSIDSSTTGDITFVPSADGTDTGSIRAGSSGSFAKTAITMNEANVGTLTFSHDDNTMKGSEYGAFSSLHTGDTLVLSVANADPDMQDNAKAYTVKSVSADGRTVTFEPDENGQSVVAKNVSIVPDNDVVVSKTFPIGSVINLDGFANNNLAPSATVTGISDDGKELFVKVDHTRFPAMSSAGNHKWSISSESYFRGGNLEYNQRISESQTISFDVKASDPAFEKIFRALGQIAQANVVDKSNPLETGHLDSQKTAKLVTEALDLIVSAIGGTGDISNAKNTSLYSISAKVSAEYTVLNKVMDNQKLAVSNLENNIGDLKDADKDEAAVKLLMAENALESSYSVLSTVMKMSLLDYIK
ncbi:MAG: hypothetical protein IJ660_02385 [Alphaproteobacteria bacterium]|nr:hypothetical protein [Alphaproteobacteria bacterium]